LTAGEPEIRSAHETLARIDVLLSTLNATDVGTLDGIREKLRLVEEELREMEQQELAERAAETIAGARPR
jgi:uncharacterized coiled-coil protein SlyX